MSQVNSIPLPNFSFEEIVKSKAEAFFRNKLKGPSYNPDKDINTLRDEIYKLNNAQDKVVFLGYAVNRIVEELAKHEKICNKPDCYARPSAQQLLYYIYGDLDGFGLPVNGSTFDVEEIVANNTTIASTSSKIEYKLDELKAGENLIYDDLQSVISSLESLKDEINSLKDMYILGKPKWYQLAKGIIGEYAANKSLDAIIAAITPEIMKLIEGHGNFLSQ